MNSLTAHGNFSDPLDRIPLKKSAITAKIVYELKREVNYNNLRFKARLVPLGIK